MNAKYVFLIIAFLILMVSKPSFALGKLGHQIVCQLAFEHLSSNKQNKITALLAVIPKQHQTLINRYNYKKENKPITFDNACTWADAIKRLEEFRVYNSWHYMNLERSNKKVMVNNCEKNCLPQAILQHQQRLAHPKKPGTWQQAQALLFLGHWLGDIHQPLHTSFSDDLGGNKTKFSHSETKCSNLHRYWDECILYKGKNSKKRWLALLNEKWQQNSQPNWHTKQVWQWANESFQFVIKPSFNYCQLDQYGCQKPSKSIRLPSNYLKQHQPIIEHQILQAAQRLTKILEASL